MSISLLHREELEKLLELGEAATKGPWTVETNVINSRHGFVGTMFLDGDWHKNAPFVAACKNALPAIRAALEGQSESANDAELRELREYVRRLSAAFDEAYKSLTDLADQAPTFLKR